MLWVTSLHSIWLTCAYVESVSTLPRLYNLNISAPHPSRHPPREVSVVMSVVAQSIHSSSPNSWAGSVTHLLLQFHCYIALIVTLLHWHCIFNCIVKLGCIALSTLACWRAAESDRWREPSERGPTDGTHVASDHNNTSSIFPYSLSPNIFKYSTIQGKI